MRVNVVEQSLYYQYFCLSLYSIDYPVKPATLYHILVGKRTASILFKAHIYHAIPFFSVFPNLNRSQYDNMVREFIEKDWIKASENNEEYYLCKKAKEELDLYFSKHFYPKNINQLLNGQVTKEFWKKILFSTQVLSELRYQNNHYLPIEKEWKTQLWLKNWLKNSSLERQELGSSFGKEWIQLLKEFRSFDAEILVAQLTGHKKNGKTSTQLAVKYGLDQMELTFLVQNTISQLLNKVVSEKETFPLFYLIYQECKGDRYSSLSLSARSTAYYLEKGYSIEKIALERRLKVNTISEHIIELAIIFPNFDVSNFIPKEDYQRLCALFSENEEITYEDLKKEMPQIPFSWYRLIQIERSRIV